MNESTLMSPSEAASTIAEMFKDCAECEISVQEDRVFKRNWFALGTVSIESATAHDELTAPLKNGAFEWCLPSLEEAQANITKLLPSDKKDEGIPARVLDEIAATGVRAGLLHPVFDAAAIEEMPYRRQTTVVSDTSGVLQGALGFVVRHLHPAARIKIPSIVHMEFVNLADRFFSLRRRKQEQHRTRELIEHLKSQGGQRALLQFELHADTEVERTYLLGDPLRSAFQPERGDLSNLNISVPIRAYADRLILEAARHHQAQSGPDHAIRLLTSDQGLARMALAEGVTPLYFSSVKATDFFGELLTGQFFGPFTGNIERVSLASVLWELATAFGSSRLESKDGSTFQVSAIGEGMSWSPYHSVDDLLWCRYKPATSTRSSDHTQGSDKGADETPGYRPHEGKSTDTSSAKQTVSYLRFDVGRLFRLICALDDNQEMNERQILEILGATTRRRGADEYRRFLSSAGLVTVEGSDWKANTAAQQLSISLRNEHIGGLREALLRTPSFSAFEAHISQTNRGDVIDFDSLKRGATTYRILGEVTLMCASVGNEGVYPTPSVPDAAAFATAALSRFSEMEAGQGLVPTGAWLESLIRSDGIHPEVARRRLDEASERGYLRRSTEGSTMQTKFDKHVVHVLRVQSGEPVVLPVHLYRGDYLIPGKASVSLRIEDPAS